MSKSVKTNDDPSKLSASTFTLTFAIEILGLDVWHDCNEGWIDLGPCVQGLKIQYQLYLGQSFDVDILIWPHVAKIWCGSQSCYVRTWQFLERRWLAFTIHHIFSVRVLEMISQEATITPSFGLGALSANAKNDKNAEVYLPPLGFAELRYFGRVIEQIESLKTFIYNVIWSCIEYHIPASYFDEVFNTPQCVTDIRQQNAVLKFVRDTILSKAESLQREDLEDNSDDTINAIDSKKSKGAKDKEKEKKKVVETPKQKYELKLSGNTILAGAGQILPFDVYGDPAQDMGEMMCLIISNNLPAHDDSPILFVIVRNLLDVPVEALKKLRISELYIKWKLDTDEYCSQKQYIKNINNVNFNYYNTVPLPLNKGSQIITSFLDNIFEIQLFGQRVNGVTKFPRLFGERMSDYDLSTKYPANTTNIQENILIAVTKIDASELAKGTNSVIKGEYYLYPPSRTSKYLGRNDICTNDINEINGTVKSENAVKASLILDANMSLDVTVGLVGCNPCPPSTFYLRLYCLIRDSKIIRDLFDRVLHLNETSISLNREDNILTGFVVDSGDIAIIYIEGPKDGHITEIWKFTEPYFSKIQILFSVWDKYPIRLYPEMLKAAMPFDILKMYATINSLLACPAVYVRPALPVPAKTALLKFGRIVSSNLKLYPSTGDMPTMRELASFRLELCVSEKPLTFPVDSQESSRSSLA